MMSGSGNGLSPVWRTTTSGRSGRTASTTRPSTSVADPRWTRIPAPRSSSVKASSSGRSVVATTRSSRPGMAWTAAMVHRTSGRPRIGSTTLPGSRVEPIRAWITPTMRIARSIGPVGGRHLVEGRDDIVDVAGGHPGEERHGQEPLVRRLGDGHRDTREALAVERVAVDRDVVHVDPDPLGPERLEDRATVHAEPIEAELHEGEMPRGIGARCDDGRVEELVAGETLEIARGKAAAGREERLDPPQLTRTQRRADIREP